MPKLKAAGLDGYRLEHIATLVLTSSRTAAGFARFASWLTADHVALGTKGPSDRFMARLGSCQVIPFRKKPDSVDPRPVTPPSALDRAVERMIDIRLRDVITEAGGARQFGYTASAGGDQATQLVRIYKELNPRCFTTGYDTKNAYSSCSNAAVLEALEKVPGLRCLIPYVRRVFAVDTGEKPGIVYYGKGRAAGVKPTLVLEKLEGLGQGKVLSTALWNICHHHILAAVREKLKDDGIDCAYIDDLTQLVNDGERMLETFDATVTALLTAGGHMNLDKVWVDIPLARSEAERQENAAVIKGLLERGVKEKNILTVDHANVEQQGFVLLGVPHGSKAFQARWIEKLVKGVATDADKVAAMAVSYPTEALTILEKSLSKRLGFAARQSSPTSSTAEALATAHRHSLAVVGHICGCNGIQPREDGGAGGMDAGEEAEAAGEAAAAGEEVAAAGEAADGGAAAARGEQVGGTQTPPLPPFATEICGLARRHGGVALQPLGDLALKGVLHLAVLTAALPKLLERLLKPNSGQASAKLAAEIKDVENSALPWAAQARAVYARVKAALAPLSAADLKLLKELVPQDTDAGKTLEWPTLLEMVTTGYNRCQEKLSRALSEREFLRVYKAYNGQGHRYMLRQGTAAGATAFLETPVAGLTDNHTAATSRMAPHIFRMALRDHLGMEPIPGTQAMLQTGGGYCCPSHGCGERLDGLMLDPFAVTQHLISCAFGPFRNKIAQAATMVVGQNFADVGVKGTTEAGGFRQPPRTGRATTCPIQ